MCEGVKIEMKKNLSTIIAAAIVASLFAPQEAKAPRPTEATRSADANAVPGTRGALALAWFETLQYDGLGVPYGHYCH